MKNSELRKLVAEYKEIKIKFTKTQNNKLKEKLKEIEHRYYHETGRLFVFDAKEIT
jgi:thermostable 8-oxoguanine DNA glycosylase